MRHGAFFSRCGIRWRDPISVYKVGAAIDGIAARLTDLTARLPAYGLKELQDEERAGSSSDKTFYRRTYSYKMEQNVVGLEEDTNLLLTQLRRTDCRVVSICGMGGLGKTTLAKKVYHQCKVGGYFDSLVWIFVYQQWGKRNIWETILYEILYKESLTDEEWKMILEKKDEGVAKLLHDELGKKKCLVVLDDIWDNAWEALSPGFPTETNSKFMITTRRKSLAHGFIHEPRYLNDDESWELFTKTAIPTRIIHSNPAPAPAAYKMDERMEILGKEMVKHCGGLPLAIVVLGGILKHNETSVEWETIHQCIRSYLKGQVISQLLALSYDDLPYELKPCFLYLAMFPEDFEISRDKLINLWMAEGIIHPPRVERQGEWRYMIVVAIGRIKRCQMHNLMRELSLSKSQEENFSKVVPLNGIQTKTLNISSSSSVMVTGRIRRLSLHLNRFPGDVALECEEYPPFKSLLGFSLDQQSGLSQTLTATLVHSLKLLRTLDLQCFKLLKHDIVPRKTTKLTPPRNLTCLLTLRIDFLQVEFLPNVFWKLTRLRHLYLPHQIGKKTKRLQFAGLTDLRTLVNFPTYCADQQDLITLPNLRRLKIVAYDDVLLQRFQKIFTPPTTFDNLRDLSISTDSIDDTSSSTHTSISTHSIDDNTRDNIKSCCPRLLLLKSNGKVVYQKTADVFSLEEHQLPSETDSKGSF
ncbi:hypothetical protein GQ457_01G048160 [Hibiscus cannabinus]